MSGIVGGAGSKSGVISGYRDNNIHPFMAKPSTTQTSCKTAKKRDSKPKKPVFRKY